MVLRKKVIENFKTEKLQGSVTYTSIIIFPTFCVSVYTLYLIIICQVFDFFFFFRFKIWVITSKEGKRGGKENSKRQLTLNREKKKKKKEALHFFFFFFYGKLVKQKKRYIYLFWFIEKRYTFT